MSQALLDREQAQWRAHAQLRLFRGADERDAMRALFPERARLVEAAQKSGRPVPTLLVPHIDADAMETLGFAPFEVRDFEGNVLCNAGIQRQQNLTIGAGGQAYDATHSALSVGDGNGSVPTAAATDSDLAALTGATHRQGQLPDATYPTAASQVLTWQATFASGVGLFHWREWAISQDTGSTTAALTAPLLNHKGTDMGDFTGTAIAKALKITITQS